MPVKNDRWKTVWNAKIKNDISFKSEFWTLETLTMSSISVIAISSTVFTHTCRKIIFGEKFVNIERRYKRKTFDGIESRTKSIFSTKIYPDHLEGWSINTLKKFHFNKKVKKINKIRKIVKFDIMTYSKQS